MARARAIGAPRLMVWGAALGLLLVVVLPFGWILAQAIFPDIGAGSLAGGFSRVADILAEGGLARATFNTILLGVGVSALSAIIAVPLAAARAFFRLPRAVLWDILFLLPFMIPPYIATLGWIMTLQPGGYLAQLTGLDLGGFLFSLPGMIFVMAMACFPVVYFALSRSFEAVGGRFADVSRVFGAAPARAFWRVSLPLALP
ncbi:iron ABC transporter permease, partial [Thioclava sp. BHET1]